MPFGLGKADFFFLSGLAFGGQGALEKRRAQALINPSFQGPDQWHPATQWRIKQADAQDGQEHGQGRSEQGLCDFRTQLVGPFSGRFNDLIAMTFEQVEQIDVKRQVGNHQIRLNPLHRLFAHDLGRALGILDPQLEQALDDRMKDAAGQSSCQGLCLVEFRAWKPA